MTIMRLASSTAIHCLCLLLACTLAGCGGLRFVVDLTTVEDALTESVVLEDDAARHRAAKIALIDVTGLIIDARKPGLLSAGENPVAELAEALQKAGDDHRVHAVVLRINSPGGTVTASDVVYREVVRFRETTNKPVVILMADLAASGGYYLACAGDHIIAHPTSITGSIGVIIQTFNFSEGMRRVGIYADSITSGENKAIGSPFEPRQPEHRALLQGLVDEFYGSFLAIVTESRTQIRADDLSVVTDGRVVTGRRAYELGLVDEVGDLHDAFAAAKALADIPSAKLVKYHRPLRHVASPYAVAPGGAPGAPGVGGTQINLLQLNLDANRLMGTPGAYYLWDPAAFGAN